MDYPKRKQNRLFRYDYSTAGTYFLTVCTKGKAKILGNIAWAGRETRLRLIAQVADNVRAFLNGTPINTVD